MSESLHASVEAFAAARPEAVAISGAGQRLSYAELNARANRLAHALIELGVGADSIVGLSVRTGVDVVVGMLGIMKSGGAYVPLDPDLPGGRLARLVAGSAPVAIVADPDGAARLGNPDLPVIAVAAESGSDANPEVRIFPEQLCYVMFTSGSTGAPKGVMVSHGNLARLFDDIGRQLDIAGDDAWSVYHTCAFGYSVWEIWGALRHGGRLVVVPPELRTDPRGFARLVRDERITIVSQTPSAFRQNFLADDVASGDFGAGLRAIVLSGEAAVGADVRRWFARSGDSGPALFNTYAITEASGQLTLHEYRGDCLDAADLRTVGRPLEHVELLVLDEKFRPLPAGEVGELFVGGPGVARGYIGAQELTAERFMELEFAGREPVRVYRTGDRARLLAGGELEFCGRADDQVKLRGYRIEPGEIEAALRAHAGVRDAAVALRPGANDQPRLVGYVVACAAAEDDDAAAFWPSVGPYQVYDEFLYDLMSSETERLDRYREAFVATVRDRVVLDIGTGANALLARMCIEAGARRVYAVEVLEDAYTKARDLVRERRLEDRIRVMHGDMSTVDLPETVDVCTQGIIGNIGSADGIVPIWNAARRFFAAECVPVPARCRTMIAAVELPDELAARPAFGRLAYDYAQRAFDKLGRRFDVRLCLRNLPATAIVSDAQVFEDLDFGGDLDVRTGGSARFRMHRDARVDGYVLWTVVTTVAAADVDESVDYLRNQQAWLPVFFPLGDTGAEPGFAVRKGEHIIGQWSVASVDGIHPDYRMETTIERTIDDGGRQSYVYASAYDERAFGATPLHRALWNGVDGPTDGDVADDDLRDWLSERLPEYMVPVDWVRLPALPLTPSGKLDRRALPAPVHARARRPAGERVFRSALEADLAELWRDVLGVEGIAADENFFDLGGDSISAVRLTSAMQRMLDANVMLVALFDAPTIVKLADYLREHHEAEVTARYSSAPPAGAHEPVVAPRDEITAPLSFPQQSFWLLEQLYPGVGGGNEQFVIPLAGVPDVAALQFAWSALLERHEILRTVFREISNDVCQFVLPHAPAPLEFVDLVGHAPDTRRAQLRKAAAASRKRAYDLGAGPLIDATLYRVAAAECYLVVDAHHIVADGLSIRVLRDDFAALYAQAVGDTAAERLALPAPAMQYREFAARQRAEFDGEALTRQLAYWSDTLADGTDGVGLPRIANDKQGDHRHAQADIKIDAQLGDALRGLARDCGATLFMTLLAATRALLFRYGEESDIPIGSPVTRRDAGATRDIVGCMVNNVVFRTRVDGAAAFRDLVRAERDTALAAFQNSAAPFERVVEAVAPQRHFGRHPLFQVLFLFEAGGAAVARGGGIDFGLTTWATERDSYWDLELSLTDGGAGEPINGYWGYSTALFDAQLGAAFPARLESWLRHVVAAPDTSLARLPLLDPAAAERMLRALNDTTVEYPHDQTLHGLFEAQVQRTPDATALICEDAACGSVTLTYVELDRRATILARRLHELCIRRGDLVGIAAVRSPELVIAIVATLKAGGAYVPLDPAYPSTRLEFIARDTGIGLLMMTGAVDAVFDADTPVVRLDRMDWSMSVPDDEFAVTQGRRDNGDPDDAAYVLYTSGSTGQPKGAVGLHRGAVNRCSWMWREFDFRPDDCFALRTSPNFVDSVWEIFGALAHGGTLKVLSDDTVREPARLIEALAGGTRAVTHLVAVPSLLAAMLDAEPDLGSVLPALRSCITSGEPLAPSLLQRFRAAAPGVTLLNTYGTSEIWDATCFDTADWDPSSGRVPIGRPIGNVRTYICDRAMQPVPVGIVGELLVGGAGIGAGYWNRPELTAAKFVHASFARDERVYKTGDLARWLPDGNIECLGRIDQQVKLRGFRIEFGEIENALLEHRDVDRVAVDLRGDAGGHQVPIAWLVARREGCGAPGLRAGLRKFLQARLPDYMVPGAFIRVESLPLTPTGKIDRAALPGPRPSDLNATDPATAYAPPRGPIEAKVAAAWRDVIGVERVGRHDDFFASGGHSLSAARLLARLRAEFDVDLGLRQLFDAPTVAGLAAEAERRRSLVPFATVGADGIKRVDRDADVQLSFGQERLWFLNELDPESPAYNIAFTIELSGTVDTAAMQAAFDRLVDRHEILRTSFPAIGGRPRQRILPGARLRIVETDRTKLDADSMQSDLWRVAAEPFDLENGPLIRVHLEHCAPGRSRLLLVVHHIISDGVSNGILFGELADLYGAIVAGTTPELTPLEHQYVEYAAWQRDPRRDHELAAAMNYWQERLRDAPPALELPTDRPRSAEQRFRGGWLWRQIDTGQADALRTLGRAHGCTLFMVMLGAFDVLLQRYSGQTDVLVGTPVAGRERVEFEALIGLFINTVVLRVDLSGDPTFADLLERVRDATLDAQAHQRLPFEKLVEALRPDRTLSHAPVFQVMFNMTPIPDRKADVGGVEFSMGRLLDHGVSTFDLTLSIGEHARSLELVYEYDSDLFDRETIERFATHYEQLLHAILEEPHRRLSRLPMLTAAEMRRLTGGSESAGSAPGRMALDLFERAAGRRPDACAVIDGHQRVDYGDLDRRANRLANELIGRGVRPGQRVAVCVERSVDALVAILAVHKSGGAYVPVDPDYPRRRVADMLETASPDAVVTRMCFAPVFAGAGIEPRRVVQLDLEAESIAARSEVRPRVELRRDMPAYVLFTSGSTGRPKGVVVSHGNLASAFAAWESAYELSTDDRHLQMAGVAFDVFTGDWVRALCSGACLVICPRGTLLDPPALYALMSEQRITVAEFVPAVVRGLVSHLQQSREDLSIMRLLIVGSDVWHGAECNELVRCVGPTVRVVNSYGVAEATIDSTWFEASKSAPLPPDAGVPIGNPFANSRVYVCDTELRPVPIGVPGELCIGGAGVAGGYVGDAKLTEAHFVADPFAQHGVLYRTGDRARWRNDGSLELLGRTDRQVKLRGFRIEPGEVEAALVAQESIAASVVVVTEAAAGDERLVAYIVPAGDAPDCEDIVRHLRERLPDYMVPSLLVPLARLPLTSNGKLDRRALPAPDWAGVAAGAAVSPRDATEAALASLFAEVLGRPAVGIHDGFFELGGHSLLATQLVARIRDAFDAELPLRALFDTPTVAGLAARLGEELSRDSGFSVPALVPVDRPAATPASFTQRRLWFLAQLEPESAAYHLHWAVRIRGKLNADALSCAVAALVERHETLRSTFVAHDGAPLQVVHEDFVVPVEFETIPAASGESWREHVAGLIARPFDLATGPLLRVQVLQVAPDEHVLVMVIHHIVADGWSMSVLFRELASAYDAYRAGRAPDWPALPVQYADYALWQRRWLTGAELERQLGYWRRQLAGAPAQLVLPTDRPRPSLQAHRAEWYSVRLSADLSRAVRDLAAAQGSTLYMVLLAAFDAVLARYSGQTDIVVGTPIAGRGRTELEGLIGFFINTLALRTDLDGDPRFDALLARVKRVALDAYAHQDVPFERIVEALQPERDRSHDPIVQVVLTVHNQPVRALELSGADVEPELVSNDASKFDLNVHVTVHESQLELAFAFDAELFDAATIEDLGGYYEQVLGAVASRPGLRLSELPVRGAPPRAAAAPVTAAGDLVTAFNARVAAAPKRLAVHTGRCSLSYGALDEQANRVARRLLSLELAGQAAPDGHAPRVGLMAAQDAPMVAGLLGILKAGAAYVPLEPSQPTARLRAIAADAGLSAVVSDGAHAGAARACFGALPVIDGEARDDGPGTDPGIRPAAEALAYIIYTSGTTGTPKGVMQTHGGALAQVNRYRAGLGLVADDRLSLLSGYGFDAAVQDLFGALLTGAAVYPFDLRGSADAVALVDQLVAARITVVHATPTVYRHLFGAELNCDHDLAAVRLVVLGGEEVRRADFELYRSRFARGTRLVNGFGLTESTMGLQSFADHDTRLLGQQVPVGTAVAGLEAELFDADGAVSWQGEIRLRGAGVFAGYWGDPDQTARCVDAAGWYRTGDLGRRLPDGQMLYVGRRDAQLKLRGQRVEPGEIEAVLGGLPGVVECAVRQVARPGDARLVAYVVADAALDEAARSAAGDDWRAALAEQLPRYMVPQAFEWLAALPRRANGKVARELLPAPGSARVRAAVPARTELEAVLTGLWRDLLQADAVGIHDDFFALGGHSLLATRLISRIRDRLGIEVPLVEFFARPDIEHVAASIEKRRRADDADAVTNITRIPRTPRRSR